MSELEKATQIALECVQAQAKVGTWLYRWRFEDAFRAAGVEWNQLAIIALEQQGYIKARPYQPNVKMGGRITLAGC